MGLYLRKSPVFKFKSIYLLLCGRTLPLLLQDRALSSMVLLMTAATEVQMATLVIGVLV